MAEKQIPAPGAKPAPAGGDLSAALEALQQAAQSLATSTGRMKQMVHQMDSQVPAGATGPEPPPAAVGAAASAQPQNQEAQRFYERLEQTGQLVNVDDATDLATLPPHVTHIRRADGSVERIGFSTSPWARG